MKIGNIVYSSGINRTHVAHQYIPGPVHANMIDAAIKNRRDRCPGTGG
jgi:hypothetical protein